MKDIYQKYLYYIAFAVIAIVINMLFQAFTEFFVKFFVPDLATINFIAFELWFLAALGVGTVAGFIFKFIVDKFFVFRDRLSDDDNIRKTTEQVSKYFLFAIFTTIIFWGTEASFYLIFGEQWYLIGGIIGLAIGYTIKFILDNRYVF
jgi:putative flippase GtrA